MHPSTANRYFFLIILLAFCVRLYDISTESLWVDELHSQKTARLSPVSAIEACAQDNHPPAYIIFLHYWIKIAGVSEFALRIPSVLFSLGALFVLYLITINLASHQTGLYTVSLCALSYFHINYAQEVRSYALILFLSLLSIHMMINLLRRIRFLYALTYLASSVLLLYTHYLGFFILLSQAIYIVYLRYYEKQKDIQTGMFLLFGGLIFISYLPWINIFYYRTVDVGRNVWFEVPDLYTVPKTLLVYAGTYTPYGILMLILMLAIPAYTLFFTEQEKKDVQLGFLAIFFCVPIVAPFLLSLFWSPIYIIRLTIVSSVFLFMLVGIGLQHIRWSYVRNGIFMVLIACSAANLYIYYSELNKERWRDAINYVDKNAVSGDLLLFNAHFGQNGFTYYADRPDLTAVPVPFHGFKITESELSDLRSLMLAHAHTWLILSHARDGDKLLNFLQSQFNQEDSQAFISYGINSHKAYAGVVVYRFSAKTR